MIPFSYDPVYEWMSNFLPDWSWNLWRCDALDLESTRCRPKKVRCDNHHPMHYLVHEGKALGFPTLLWSLPLDGSWEMASWERWLVERCWPARGLPRIWIWEAMKCYLGWCVSPFRLLFCTLWPKDMPESTGQQYSLYLIPVPSSPWNSPSYHPLLGYYKGSNWCRH